MIRILIAEDHDVMRQGIRSLLETQSHCEVCGEARDGREAVEMALSLKPDVAVLDLTMPALNGLEVTRQLRNNLPQTGILIFTIHESDSLVRDVLAAGAHGYILKSDAADSLIAAVEAIARQNLYFSSRVSDSVLKPIVGFQGEFVEELPNNSHLTSRELEIVRMLALGKSNKEIASSLYISVRTVETHRRAILRKLDIHSVVQLVHYAIRHRIVN